MAGLILFDISESVEPPAANTVFQLLYARLFLLAPFFNHGRLSVDFVGPACAPPDMDVDGLPPVPALLSCVIGELVIFCCGHAKTPIISNASTPISGRAYFLVILNVGLLVSNCIPLRKVYFLGYNPMLNIPNRATTRVAVCLANCLLMARRLCHVWYARIVSDVPYSFS